MSKPVDPTALQKLEKEAMECERQNDFVSALDIYEEIDRNGWSSPRHLLALGECYMHARQRQNAREAWIRAFEADSSMNEVIQLLDRYFPGWEKTAVKHHGQEEAPPPPPAFSDTQAGLTMESVSYRTPPAPAPAVPPPPPPARKQPPMPPKPAPAAATQLSTPARPAAPQPPPIQQQIRMQPAQVIIEAAKVVVGEGGPRESKVNWSFILADAAEEAAKQQRRHAARNAAAPPAEPA
ncbi:MAG: hypothetical protein ABFD69_02485 [Candidatus Sumerlaeia bacterium]